jgi:hypothetical protein
MPTIRDLFRPGQLRWSDVNWGPVDPLWPAISFSSRVRKKSQLSLLGTTNSVQMLPLGHIFCVA